MAQGAKPGEGGELPGYKVMLTSMSNSITSFFLLACPAQSSCRLFWQSAPFGGNLLSHLLSPSCPFPSYLPTPSPSLSPWPSARKLLCSIMATVPMSPVLNVLYVPCMCLRFSSLVSNCDVIWLKLLACNTEGTDPSLTSRLLLYKFIVTMSKPFKHYYFTSQTLIA